MTNIYQNQANITFVSHKLGAIDSHATIVKHLVPPCKTLEYCTLNILIEKVHLDDLDLHVIMFCCVSNISFTLIISIETY